MPAPRPFVPRVAGIVPPEPAALAMDRRALNSTRSPGYWGWLVFFIAAVLVLAALSIRLASLYQTSRTQDELERETRAASEKLRAHFFDLASSLSQYAERYNQGMRAQGGERLTPAEAQRNLTEHWGDNFNSLPALLRIEIRDPQQRLLAQIDAPPPSPRLQATARDSVLIDTRVAMEQARDRKDAMFSHSYYATYGSSYGTEIIDLVIPIDAARVGFYVLSFSLSRTLETALPAKFLAAYGVSVADVDGSLVARPAGLLFRQSGQWAEVPVRVGDQALLLRASRPEDSASVFASTQLSLLLLLCLVLIASGIMLWRALRQRRAVEKYLLSETTLRRAMEDSLTTGLRARDMEGRILYVNRAFCEITGFQPSELIGMKPPMPYWAPEGTANYQRRYAQVLAGNVSREAHESTFMRKNGERFPVLIHEAPLIDASGQQTGWMSSVIDISELKRAEDTNRRQQEQLQAHARMAMLGEVATVLSHEINQPLSAIQSYATASQNLLESGNTSGAEQALQRLLQQAERAAQVVRSVGQFMRRRKLTFEAIRVAETIEALQPIIQLQAKRFGVQVLCRLDQHLLVRGDRTMFEQALLNLTRNAVEAMEKTPPEMRLLEIVASAQQAEAGVQIEVIDRGHGVPQAQVPQLFAPFHTTKKDGIGVGLSLSRTVAEAFGGSLAYQAHPDGGSVFVLKLPAYASQTESVS